MMFELNHNSEKTEDIPGGDEGEEDDYSWRSLLKSFWKSWYRKILFYLIIPIVILNFWLFRYDDLANNCHVKIYPSITEWNNLDIKRAINLMKNKSFPDYQKFCQSVKAISPELACGGMGGGCYSKIAPNEIVVSTIFRPKESHTETTAAIITHEVCHLYQNKEGRPMDEAECYLEYCRILKKMGVRKDYDSRCNTGQ
jgi:hypothetical protein